jgi:hypothetical protein
MLSAYIDGNNLVVKVEGSIAEFAESLTQLKDTFNSADREFDSNRKAWIVRNLDTYAAVPLVKNARRSAEMRIGNLFERNWNEQEPV